MFLHMLFYSAKHGLNDDKCFAELISHLIANPRGLQEGENSIKDNHAPRAGEMWLGLEPQDGSAEEQQGWVAQSKKIKHPLRDSVM